MVTWFLSVPSHCPVNYGKPLKHQCITSTQNDNIECFNSSLPGQNGSKITDDVLLCQWKLVNLNIFLIEVSSLGVFEEKYHWFRSWLYGEQGPVSISDKTSYRKISWSFEATRLVFRIVRLLWNLTGTSAALLPRRLSYFRAIRWFKLPISRLRDFTRSYHKTSYRRLKWGPGNQPLSKAMSSAIHICSN